MVRRMSGTYAAVVDLSDQWHYWPNGEAYDGWNVARLISLAAGLPTEQVAIADIAELDTNYWFHAGHEPTVRHVVQHARHALVGVDPSYPVILGPDGRVMDGMHRIVRAMLDGATHVNAVRFAELPPPDLEGVELSTGR